MKLNQLKTILNNIQPIIVFNYDFLALLKKYSNQGTPYSSKWLDPYYDDKNYPNPILKTQTAYPLCTQTTLTSYKEYIVVTMIIYNGCNLTGARLSPQCSYTMNFSSNNKLIQCTILDRLNQIAKDNIHHLENIKRQTQIKEEYNNLLKAYSK